MSLSRTEPKTFKRPRLYYHPVWDRLRIIYPNGWSEFFSGPGETTKGKWYKSCFMFDFYDERRRVSFTGQDTLDAAKYYEFSHGQLLAEFICEL